MNLQEIEERVTQLDLAEGPELIHSLLSAYGFPKAAISRVKTGTYNRSSTPGETLWKNRVMDRYVDGEAIDLHALIDDAASDERVMREHPRFLIVRNAARLLALDTKTRDTLDISLAEISANAAFFLPWAGIEKQQLENLHYADVKAAERMARLYVEIVKANAVETQEEAGGGGPRGHDTLATEPVIVARTATPQGHEIVLTAGRWAKILAGHPEIADHLELILHTVSDPEHREPDTAPGRERHVSARLPRALDPRHHRPRASHHRARADQRSRLNHERPHDHDRRDDLRPRRLRPRGRRALPVGRHAAACGTHLRHARGARGPLRRR